MKSALIIGAVGFILGVLAQSRNKALKGADKEHHF